VIEVQEVGPDDWRAVRDIRLRALADSPFAFASTLAREEAMAESRWRERLGSGHWWLCRDGDAAVGMVSSYTEDGSSDERHLVAMWVAPDRRGTPAASFLVEAVCERASADGARAVVLWVADGNDRARRFYERLGFRPTGVRQPLPSNPDVGEELMRRRLAG
jgi:ribosomal protein S18 acetylase RimI-like enzyme